ncbi:type II toxin-antitoxin system Phd/YefM family antitoxin [Nocardioides sp. Kera G14]|uniref:type II toxin-antitoxin system Phd/YefM family antitoxin n=1 Tax=Nocardioides sp. Kera G14 TaxID=2884264 RepID=UPI001D1186D6|nr:type II toxin-antitoxin system prevent-host-death family antitoxin [Nocardioides sp. Kera G14]UDY23021.1 type II toxin-antitoxin system prevent-host-death family antitoxin [Nocardioides sp. Kera G14]
MSALPHEHGPRTISHRELRNNSAQVLRDVEAGETFIITNNGRPVAQLMPPGSPLLPIAVPRDPSVRATDLVSHTASRPSKEILDELREERV